jgi:hypothetical protein
MVDELLYSELAKGIAEDGRLHVRREPTSYLSLLYPIAIAPAWLASSMDTTYAVVKAINAVLITLAVVPVYLWARRLMTPSYAVVTALLALLMPSLLYSGMVMTENAFLPAFLVATFSIARALERPTLARQALALGAVVLAVLVRVQGVVLILVLLTAIALDALLEARGGRAKRFHAALTERFRAFRHSLILLGLAAAGYGIFKLVEGEPLSTGLGVYRAAGSTDYSPVEVARWTLYHAAELCLSVGLIPVSAFLVLTVMALRGPGFSEAERAFVAVTASAVAWLVLTVGAFASRFALRIEERTMFHLAPLFLLALGVWLARGAPRPPKAAIGAAFVPVVFIAFLPLERFLDEASVYDAFGLLSLLRLAGEVPGGPETVRWITVGGACVAALLFVSVPRALFRTLAPAAVAVFFVLTTYAVSGAIRDHSRLVQQITYESDAEWIDERIGSGSSAVYLFDGAPDEDLESPRLWQTEFWNRSLSTVYWLGGVDHDGLPGEHAAIDSSTGTLVRRPGRTPIRSRYVVTGAPGLAVAGELVERKARLALYRTPGTVAVDEMVRGRYADGWMGGRASYMRFGSPGNHPGLVRVAVSRSGWAGPDVPGRVRIRVGPSVGRFRTSRIGRVTAERRWVIHSSTERTFVIPTPRPPFRVEVRIDPTFSPSRFGLPDPRKLGAQVRFTFAPRPRSEAS